jgi:hypothetical protein
MSWIRLSRQVVAISMVLRYLPDSNCNDVRNPCTFSQNPVAPNHGAFRRLPMAAGSRKRELGMPEAKQERWRELCEMAIVESDPRRLTELFQQIDLLLSDGEDRPDALQSGAA